MKTIERLPFAGKVLLLVLLMVIVRDCAVSLEGTFPKPNDTYLVD